MVFDDLTHLVTTMNKGVAGLQYLYAFSSQRYRELRSQKSGAVESSRESLLAADSLRPVTETTTDCTDENSLSDETGSVTNLNSIQPIITLTRLTVQTENQQQAEPDPTSQDSISTSATSTGNTDQELSLHIKEETTSQVSVVLENPAELPAGSREEPDSEPAAAAEDANGDEEEREAPAVPGKKNGTGKAKPKRRSGRATNRR